MRFKVFSVYDSKMEEFGVPMFLRSRGECIRAFSDVIGSSESPISKHPGDYTLFEIGDYDATTGAITMYEAKISLGLALDFTTGRVNDTVKNTISAEHPNRETRPKLDRNKGLKSVQRSI